jgi:flagellar motor switch protein FliG
MEMQQRSHARNSAGVSAIAGILQAAGALDRTAMMQNLARHDQSLAERLSASGELKTLVPHEPKSLVRETVSPQGYHQETTAQVAGNQPLPKSTSPSISIVFEELVDLDGPSLKKLFAKAEPELVLLALAGADERFWQHLAKQLPKQAAADLRRYVENLGPTRLSDVEQAQQELAALAGQLAASGQIHIAPAHFAVTV